MCACVCCEGFAWVLLFVCGGFCLFGGSCGFCLGILGFLVVFFL